MASANSPKFRDYFITINQGAECYEHVQEIINELNFKLYAYILHNKDMREDDNGELILKEKHIHVVIELRNPISFKSISEKFTGAHIEVPKYKKSAYQYLLHNVPNAKDKYQYELNEIISNNLDEIKLIIESETFELFYENMFLRYIVQGVRTPYQFVKRFGLNAYRQYWSAYNDMLKFATSDDDMIQDMQEIQRELDDAELPF